MKNYYLLACTCFLFFTCAAQTPPEKPEKLKDVSFGFAAGFSASFRKTYDYALFQGDNSLTRQKLGRAAFVVSSMITIKLTPLELNTTNNQIQSQEGSKPATFWDRVAVNVGLNLLEISNSVEFNKSIDGGIGLGYYIHKNTQVAIMFEAASVRQLRDDIEEKYLGKPIPKGTTFYNALDESDDNLFYNKFVTGISFKVVFSL